MTKQKTYKVNATIFLKSGGSITNTEIIKSFGKLKEEDLGVKSGWKYDKLIINSIEEAKWFDELYTIYSDECEEAEHPQLDEVEFNDALQNIVRDEALNRFN